LSFAYKQEQCTQKDKRGFFGFVQGRTMADVTDGFLIQEVNNYLQIDSDELVSWIPQILIGFIWNKNPERWFLPN
jgi:hypothetical protein